MLEVRESAPDHLAVVGTVDLVSGAALRLALHDAVEHAISAGVPKLEVDLHDVDFVDAAGLGILLGAHRRARRGGVRLSLVRPSPEFARVLLVSRLYRVLDVQDCELMEPGGPASGGDVPLPRDHEADDSQMVAS
jgi:anti-anti-sigma factor